MQSPADTLADAVFEAVRGYVEQRLDAALQPLREQIAALPAEGPPGKDAPPVDTAAIVADVLRSLPAPRDGKDGEPGPKGDRGDDGVSLIGPPGDAGRDGRDGKDGKPGRDAAQIDVLDGIDEARSYTRGTFARHRGGLWRAKDTTDGMDGWECVVRGIDREDETSEEGGRVIKRTTVYSDGATFVRVIKTHAMLHRGVYAEGVEYAPGDTVTWAGAMWHCAEQTADKPGEGSKCWRLAVKRGRDGKDATK